MKTGKMHFIMAGLVVLGAVAPVFSLEEARDEQRLEAAAGELNKKEPQWQKRVVAKIKAQFGVNEARVMGLRYRKLGYGEIAIALALAQGLRRGITDKNLHTIVAMRQGPPVVGWGKLADNLGLKLGPIISKVKTISAEVHKQQQADKIKTGHKAEGLKVEKPGRAVKAERPEKTEMAGMKAMVRQ